MLNALRELSSQSREFIVPSTIERRLKPTALEFLRNYVLLNKPVIIVDAVKDWSAFQKWNFDYINQKLSNKLISVSITPNGKADSIVDDQFVLPFETQMTFNQFQLEFQSSKQSNGPVYYIQHQCSNFTDEFACLADDIDSDIDWASEALGKHPDAVNIWIGENRSVSSLHKDHYENLYAVICGQKIFKLFPPTDFYALYQRNYVQSSYQRLSENSNQFKIIKSEPEVEIPWISVDPDQPDFDRFPLFKEIEPLIVELNEGELLYLPSMWYHHVSQREDQTGKVIAVNYWYDMDFASNYTYFKFLESISTLNSLN